MTIEIYDIKLGQRPENGEVVLVFDEKQKHWSFCGYCESGDYFTGTHKNTDRHHHWIRLPDEIEVSLEAKTTERTYCEPLQIGGNMKTTCEKCNVRYAPSVDIHICDNVSTGHDGDVCFENCCLS